MDCRRMGRAAGDERHWTALDRAVTAQATDQVIAHSQRPAGPALAAEPSRTARSSWSKRPVVGARATCRWPAQPPVLIQTDQYAGTSAEAYSIRKNRPRDG